MLVMPIAQNIAACENQGNQWKLSDHWKSVKTLFLKKITGMMQKRQKDCLNSSFN